MRPQAVAEVIEGCPVCGGDDFPYLWSSGSMRFERCAACGVVRCTGTRRTTIQPNVWTERDWQTLAALVTARQTMGGMLVVTRLEDVPPQARAVLESAGAMIAEPQAAEARGNPQTFATVLIASGLSEAAAPLAFLERIRLRLTDDGVVLVAQPVMDSRAARMMGRRWQGWDLPARWHFTRKTLHLLLLKAGFGRVWVRDLGRARRLQTPLGRVLASASPQPRRTQPRVSIIVPVFNEARTCAALLDQVLAKTLPGLEKEVVIVESNSSDGTRAIVERYRSQPTVRLILEERPRGKGFAVRSGLAEATGDLVLIQDGDLEYDIEDYESLLAPLIRWEALFVLGSRHTGHWKMRVFNDAPVTAAVFNLGQVFYTTLVNLVLGTAMTDPFTMFKVFRRDCLHGLAFSGRRFDFDFEIVMKLVRKGYAPLELPVNYNARSFAEGKKVSFVRDGLTWVWVVLKYGFGPLGPGDHDRFPGSGRS